MRNISRNNPYRSLGVYDNFLRGSKINAGVLTIENKVACSNESMIFQNKRTKINTGTLFRTHCTTEKPRLVRHLNAYGVVDRDVQAYYSQHAIIYETSIAVRSYPRAHVTHARIHRRLHARLRTNVI